MTDKEQDDRRTSDAFIQQWLEQQQQFWRLLAEAAGVAAEQDDAGAQPQDSQYWSDVLTEQQRQLQELGQSLLQAMQDQHASQNQQARQDQKAHTDSSPHTDSAHAETEALCEQLASLFTDHLQKAARLEASDQYHLPPHVAACMKQFQAGVSSVENLPLSRFPFLLQTFGQRQQHYQQQSQSLFQAWHNFMQAYRHYQEYESELLQTCASTFAQRLKARAVDLDAQSATGDSASIQLLSDMFTLWAECYDSEHQRQSADSDYRHAYGELLNTSLALRQSAQAFIHAEDYRMLGLVPRQDYLELLQQHHRLRKEVRNIQQRHQQQISELEQRISALERPARSKKPSQQQATQQQSK